MAGFFLAQLLRISCFKVCAILAKCRQWPSALGRKAWQLLINDHIAGAYEQSRLCCWLNLKLTLLTATLTGGLDVKAEMEHIAINDFIVASFDA